MESLNLNTLANSLPAGQQNAEKELLNNFKAAALSITTLYRSSRKSAKRAYNTGYATACQDLLNFIQQGVSAESVEPTVAGPSSAVDGGGMTIGRVMDWIEARLEAIKALEDDDDEDEEKERRPHTTAPARKPAVPGPSSLKIPQTSSLPTPSSPITQTNGTPPEPSSPSPPPSTVLRPNQLRSSKHKTPAKVDPLTPLNAQTANIIPSAFNFTETLGSPSANSTPFPDAPLVGAKRRHVMMMMDSASPVVSAGSTVSSPSSNAGSLGSNPLNHSGSTFPHRRRTRSSRNLAQAQNQNVNVIPTPSEAMDIEEDGRERKRVARR
ncbi:hypothetical protein CC1G_02105 [Coprinopsis cinerea okayama7|uniref:Uncharacterized protein n=1 Tax=Coprinopsis cinerea (strain Okayama-7 / 130 / ATCC MYA-4618 / FGSC 9003) TaxID=240176 RepID=A8NK74_COPC7|nr:hypothetical protein CC1G_02105 [Coprinopsis cinerea okayama7\|eukprot:XP_001834369.1 hypothetical protein CC1G_02105 [Coprinopsis cinerea okayama7\